MKKLLLGVLIFLLVQQITKAQIGWGEIDPAQFAIKVCPIDSSANAMVLFSRCVISFKFEEGELRAVYNIRRRIQILTKEGFGEGTVSLHYYSSKNDESITEIKAQTINLGVDNKIQITRVDKKSMFEESNSELFSARKFTFPDVKEGSVIEYEYTLESKSIRFLRDWVFQSSIPTLRSYVKVQSPGFLHYTSISETSIPLSENSSSNITVNFPTRFYYGKEKFPGENIDVPSTEALFAINNIPALKAERYITTLKDYEAKMVFVLSSITMPLRAPRTYTTNWDELGEEMMKNKNFGLYLDGMGDHIKAAKDLAAAYTTPVEKAKAVYANIMFKVKWNEHHALFPLVRPAKTYADGTGNSADVNMLLVDMLRAAGLNADPVLVSTRQHGKIQKLLPDMAQFNHVIVMLQTDSENILLDAASGLMPFGMVALADLNAQGLRIGHDKTQWVDIMPLKKSGENILCKFAVDDMGNLTGTTSLVAEGYDAVELRNLLSKKSATDCIKEDLHISADAELNEVRVEHKNDIDQKLKCTFEVSMRGGNTDSNLIYLKPFPVSFYADNPFKLSARTYPVNFAYPFEQNLKMYIAIPDSYRIAEVPKSIQATISDESAGFTFLVAAQDHGVQINASLKIKNSEYQPDIYPSLKSIFGQLINAYNTTIVLQKK